MQRSYSRTCCYSSSWLSQSCTKSLLNMPFTDRGLGTLGVMSHQNGKSHFDKARNLHNRTPTQGVAHLVPRCFSLAQGSGHGVRASAALSPTGPGGRGSESARMGVSRGEAARAAAMSSSAGALSALAWKKWGVHPVSKEHGGHRQVWTERCRSNHELPCS